MSPVQETHFIEYPTDYLFKAFGPVEPDGIFLHSVVAAIRSVIPLALDSVKTRLSSGGKYLCVSVVVRLENVEQRGGIYTAIQRVDGLKFLL